MFAQLAAFLDAYLAVAGINTPSQAAGWANMGFLPTEAERWIADGVTDPWVANYGPKDRVFSRDAARADMATHHLAPATV